MTFSAKEMIQKRKSVRTYDGRPLSTEDWNALKDYVGALENPFGVPVEFRLLDAEEHGLTSPVIIGEHAYLAAKVKREGNFEIAFGYCFEKACLYALSLGIGTVMLAASLNRSAFEQAMEVQEDEVLAVASPVGYPAEKKSLRERAMRRAIKADDRLPFGELFFDGSFGKALGEGDLGFVPSLKMVQLAPSAANKQPWRAVVDGSKVHFYEASTMKESPLGDVQKVDIGIALAHFEMSMEEEGYAGRFVFEDPGLEAPAGVKYIVTYVKQED